MQISSEVETAIDVIIGGPPCQAFARVGRSKLREIADHPEAFRQDPRANLYLRYLNYVKSLNILSEKLEQLKIAGIKVEFNSVEFYDLKKKIVPPYDPFKFPNKWRKIEADKPARTLMAHLGKDTYSHIHYDSIQARTISVREAARLQSFPDGFTFVGTMNSAFRQIGNAVPPLLAKAIANQMFEQIQTAILCKESLLLKDLLPQT
ncbi:DNA cytosine methyltransferase [Nostocaceae cyanobacterium CENA357]|uniref:DNA (cytosine-5-)-methyltransferase n=1 Tax=Atlanticothrix silvestris CENA357 TaxID=1725252 RepID=A0A8J7H425_9CYAN|nr:DNA cytosine methyltransferase [Atlanticothrix silvestris CENA357]